jgi:hypothetical protein
LYTEQLAASKATTKPEKANFVSYEKKIIITSFSRQHHHFSSANKLSLFVLSTRLIPCCKIRYKNMCNLKCILKLSFFRRLSHIFAVVLRDDLIYILHTYLFDLHFSKCSFLKRKNPATLSTLLPPRKCNCKRVQSNVYCEQFALLPLLKLF